VTENHPITPPLELLKQWEDDWFEEREHADVLLIQAFQAGADQELEACLNWLTNRERFPVGHEAIEDLKADRRPKPPSLKEQALEALAHILNNSSTQLGADTIRRALEKLDD
jgi:hypothetical protein